MAKDQTRRLSPKKLQADKDSMAALATLSPAYAPSNAAYSLVNMQGAKRR